MEGGIDGWTIYMWNDDQGPPSVADVPSWANKIGFL
jgi:hypothetical protein